MPFALRLLTIDHLVLVGVEWYCVTCTGLYYRPPAMELHHLQQACGVVCCANLIDGQNFAVDEVSSAERVTLACHEHGPVINVKGDGGDVVVKKRENVLGCFLGMQLRIAYGNLSAQLVGCNEVHAEIRDVSKGSCMTCVDHTNLSPNLWLTCQLHPLGCNDYVFLVKHNTR